MSLETLKNLPLVGEQKTPLSATAQSFYANTFANGSGPQGTYLLTDFLGTAIGVTVGQYFNSAATIIYQQASALSAYDSLLETTVGVLDGTYGDPVTGPVDIPTGPAAGTYATGDDAITAIIPLLEAEIVTAAAAMGSAATTLNSDWNAICSRIVYEATNQSRASLQMYALIAGDKLSVMALMQGLNGIGNQTETGMAAQYFESIADITTKSGQAIVGALREGRNNTALDSVAIRHDNFVPPTPVAPPPQAPLIPAQYTPTEARAQNSIFRRIFGIFGL